MKENEKWEYPGNNPTWKTNYACEISSTGLWHIESAKFKRKIYGKSIFVVKLKEGANSAPTMADQNNFMSGLLECDWRNDTFKFEDGSDRCSSFNKPPTFEFLKRLRIFQQVLDFYKNKYNGQTKLCNF